ncbi:MAG: hypothetical protein ACTHLK_08795 [Brucella intermedia]
MSKRGSSYLRRLLIHGARTCLLHLDRTRDRLGVWLDGLQARMHNSKAAAALAAKNCACRMGDYDPTGRDLQSSGSGKNLIQRQTARSGIVMTRQLISAA